MYGEPSHENKGHVDFGGVYLTHAIWRNSYGSYQPETGVRTHAAGLKDFRLIQHNCDDWALVTVMTLAGLAKGWNVERIGDLIEWQHQRLRSLRMKAEFRKMHDDFVTAISH